jgi:hypothetical protein
VLTLHNASAILTLTSNEKPKGLNKKMKNHQRTLYKLLSIAIVAVTLVAQVFPVANVSAAQITDRSLTLIGTNAVGGSLPGGVVTHEYKFRVPTGADIGSIKFEYCTLAAGTCTMPTGLITTGGSTTLIYEDGATGFTLNKTTNGAPFIYKDPAVNIPAATLLTFRISNITNPTTLINPPTVPNQTFFVRISTYASIDTTGSPVDTGTTAASTNKGIDLSGAMPESLVFCTGAEIGLTATVPDCNKATSGAVAFNQLFSPTDTATATSQMAASTNAGSGYNITVNGATLTSGANTISPMGSRALGAHGVSQFGLNLRLNTTLTSTVAVGAEIAVPSNGTNYRAQALAGYDTVDEFKFTSTDSVANSGNASLGGSDAQIMTVSYIVNVPGSQPAGTYTTTLTYICTPTF